MTNAVNLAAVASTTYGYANATKLQSGGVTTNALAWVNFNGVTTTSIRASYNISSVTRNATGDYTLNFTNALADANYAAVASGNGTTITNYGRILGPYGTAPTQSAYRFNSNDYAGTFTDLLYAFVVIFGN